MDDAQDVLTTVRRKYDDLTHSQKRIAEAIVEDPEFVAFATVDKLADRLGIAPSTVVRFAYKIGFGGYPDLQERVRRVVRGQMRGASGASERDDELGAHLTTGQSLSLQHDVDNLRQTIVGLEAGLITNAVSLLVGARQVFVVGGYASGALAAYAALTLERIRNSVYLIENRGGRHIPALFQSDSRDVLLAIGFAPYSTDTVEVMELARESGLKLVGITDTPISPVGQRVDVVLSSRVSGVGAQNSLVAPLSLVNVLINEMTAAIPEAIKRYDTMMTSMDRWGHFVLSGSENGDRKD